MKRLKLEIYGKVQGVFYRASAQAKAQELGLTGFVYNQPDGSVYAEAQGEATKLDALVSWSHKGPEAANVELVNTQEKPVVTEEQGFEIWR